MKPIKRTQEDLVINDITPKEFADYFIGNCDSWQADVLDEIGNQFYDLNLEMQILYFTRAIEGDSKFWWFLEQIEAFKEINANEY